MHEFNLIPLKQQTMTPCIVLCMSLSLLLVWVAFRWVCLTLESKERNCVFIFVIDIELEKTAPKASRDNIVILKKEEGAVLYLSEEIACLALANSSFFSLSLAIIVKRNSEAVASAALPSYEGKFWGMSSGELGV